MIADRSALAPILRCNLQSDIHNLSMTYLSMTLFH